MSLPVEHLSKKIRFNRFLRISVFLLLASIVTTVASPYHKSGLILLIVPMAILVYANLRYRGRTS
jgi:hypothetical protein